MLHFNGHGQFGCYCRHCQEIRPPNLKECNVCGKQIGKPEGYLAFENKNNMVDWVGSDKIGHRFNSELRLAVLSACRSSVVRGPTLFGGVAPSLIRSGVPAVVGTQLPISFEAAAQFAEGFYTSLSQYELLPMAVNAGRQKLLRTASWFIPVLYLRSTDDEGRLFVENKEQNNE